MLKILYDFEIQTYPLVLSRKLDFVLINKKKRTSFLVDFAVPVDHKENKKRDIAGELRELW